MIFSLSVSVSVSPSLQAVTQATKLKPTGLAQTGSGRPNSNRVKVVKKKSLNECTEDKVLISTVNCTDGFI